MNRELIEFLENAGTPVVGVVGDLMLDRYLWGRAERVSPEAPVPVVDVDRSRTFSAVGGAGSVMRDLVALGARVWAGSIVGNDEAGGSIISMLEKDGIDISGVILDDARRTTLKTRLLSGSQHMMRIDEDESRPISLDEADSILAAIEEKLPETDILILSDYIPERGLLSRELISAIASKARAEGVPVWADPARGRDFRDFAGVWAVTPNRRETAEATAIPIPPGTLPEDAARWLLEELSLDAAVVTLDVEGIYYLTKDGRSGLVEADARGAYDVTGAGDMVIAAVAFAIGCGLGIEKALALANFAAGMAVERIGVQPIERREMLRRLRSTLHLVCEKLLSPEELLGVLDEHRRKGEKIAFTNGCFDVLHPGHVKFLAFAKNCGDVLVVGLNSDSSVASLKGDNRPILTQAERSTVLAAIEHVDYITIFDEATPAALINSVRPDILVKGEDWRERGVVGRETVEAAGGKVVLAPLVEGVSSTNIIERILAAFSGGSERGQD